MGEIKLIHKRKRSKVYYVTGFQSQILETIDVAPKALHSKALDLSNSSKLSQICLEKLEKYRYEFGDLKMDGNSVRQNWSMNPEFP